MICAIGRCFYEFDHRGAAPSLEKGEPTQNSKSLGAEISPGCPRRECPLHVCVAAALINFTWGCSAFPIFVETSSRPILFFLLVLKSGNEQGFVRSTIRSAMRIIFFQTSPSGAERISANEYVTHYCGADIRP